MDRLKNYILIFIILTSQYSIAQINNQSFALPINFETINIQTNAATFIVGETLLYKINCFAQQSKALGSSKIAYVELIDKNKNNLFKHKLFLENGQANNNYFIPSSIPSGNYKLVGYTNLMLNQKENKINVLDINIINPYEKNTVAFADSLSSNKEKFIANFTNDIDLKLSKTDFKTRELVNIEAIANTEVLKNGNYSVSVRKIDSLSTAFSNNNSQEKLPSDIAPIPEIRGEIIQGKIVAKQDNIAVDNKVISLSIKGHKNDFKITKTDNLGRFIFNLENQNSSKNILLQIVDPEREKYKIELNTPSKLNFSSLVFKDLILNSSITAALEKRAVANQIENAYYSQTIDSTKAIKTRNSFFDSKLIFTYNLNDYTRFPSIKETLIEITRARLELVKDKEDYILRVNDFDIKNEFPYQSLVLFDGILIQNIKDILDFNTKQLESISVIPGGYEYGPQKYNGIVIFKSKNDDYQLKEKSDAIVYPDLLRPEIDREFLNTDYSKSENTTRIPDYRYQLLWNPSFSLNNAQNLISFYTSDVTGEFEIIVQGTNAEGNQIKVRKIISVK